MSESKVVVNELLLRDDKDINIFHTVLNQLSGAKLLHIKKPNSDLLQNYSIKDNAIAIDQNDCDFRTLTAVYEINNLGSFITPDSHERHKIGLEDKWRKRTYTMSIITAILSAIVAISVAIINTESKKESPSIEISKQQAQECANSLVRLNVLVNQANQTTANVKATVDVHEAQCREFILGLVE